MFGCILSFDEINNLIEKRRKELEIESFEEELLLGIKHEPISTEGIYNLEGTDFESYLEKLFGRLGYMVAKTPITGDQGADLIIEKNGERVVVQAKRYSGVVSSKVVQEVVAAIKHYKCDRAIVVTTSNFTKNAVQLASTNNVELWSGKRLREVVNNANQII